LLQDTDEDFSAETDDDLLIILEKVSSILKFQTKKKQTEVSWTAEVEVRLGWFPPFWLNLC